MSEVFGHESFNQSGVDILHTSCVISSVLSYEKI